MSMEWKFGGRRRGKYMMREELQRDELRVKEGGDGNLKERLERGEGS